MAKRLVFRKFVEAREIVESRIRSKEFYGEDDLIEQKQLAALKEIFSYIKNETWTGHQKSRIKAVTFIKNRCDYAKTKEDLGAKSKNSIEASMSYLSKQLEQKIGTDTIDLIISANEGNLEVIDMALTQFRIGTGKLNPKNIFLDGFLELIPRKADKKYCRLEECEEEIRFLLMFTENVVSNLVTSRYNQTHFASIMHILISTDKKVAEERELLYKLFKGGFGKDNEGNKIPLKVQVDMVFQELQKSAFV